MVFTLFALFPVVDGRCYGSTNEIQSDEREAPVTQVNQPLGSVAPEINCAPNDGAKAECGNDETVQKNNWYAKPLRNKKRIPVKFRCRRVHSLPNLILRFSRVKFKVCYFQSGYR